MPKLFERLGAAAERWGVDWDVLCVDDGSKDRTWELLKAQAAKDARWSALRFSRNFGHQMAASAGVEAAKGDAVVLIDADLQDSPEVVAEFVAKWKEGYEVVYGVRTDRAGESAFKLWTAKAFYRFINSLSEVPIPLDTGDFRLMDRKVVEALKKMPERDRFLRGMVSWLGFRQIGIPYKREKRFAGKSKYPLRKMLRFAADGILSFSIEPLKLAAWMGFAASGVAMLGILYVLAMRLFTNEWVAGWTLLMIAVLFMGGVQLVCLGVIGEYVGRAYREGKRRPLFIVTESTKDYNRLGFENR